VASPNDDEPVRASSSSGCSPRSLQVSTATVGVFEHEVKFWWSQDEGVEASRPSHCGACGAAAHGHGSRERTVCGPPTPDGAPRRAVVRVRRYRCTRCRAARTVQRPGLAAQLRYSLNAITLALTAWAL
jgi:hypothetical protein